MKNCVMRLPECRRNGLRHSSPEIIDDFEGTPSAVLFCHPRIAQMKNRSAAVAKTNRSKDQKTSAPKFCNLFASSPILRTILEFRGSKFTGKSHVWIGDIAAAGLRHSRAPLRSQWRQRRTGKRGMAAHGAHVHGVHARRANGGHAQIRIFVTAAKFRLH